MRKYKDGELITKVNGIPYYYIGRDAEFKDCFIVGKINTNDNMNYIRVSRNYNLVSICVKDLLKEELNVYSLPEKYERIVKRYENSDDKEVNIAIYDENKITVEYTGGGIWIAEKVLDNSKYAVVDNDCMDCLTVYRDSEEKYMMVDMVFSKNIEDLNKEEKKIYMELVTELKKKIKAAGGK